jgi:sugar O-acyltransferase (sialic acid O-acetyltransferase NeuD family)
VTGIVIWGVTGQMRVLVEMLSGTLDHVVALVDQSVRQSPIPGVPLFADARALDVWMAANVSVAQKGYAAIGGARGAERRAVQQLLRDRGLSDPPLVHRTAFVAGCAKIGDGSQILAHARICAAAKIGHSVIVNTGASVDHDCELADGVHIGPGAVLAGEVNVGTDAFVGAGAIILPRITIGNGAIIGAGAIVNTSVEDGITVVGNPARRLENI